VPEPSISKIACDAVPVNRRRGGALRVLLSPRTVGATSGFLGVLALEPGEFVSEHYHPYSEEFLYVTEGALLVRLDGTTEIRLAAREALMIPKNVRHRVVNDVSGPAAAVFHLSPLAPSPELGHVDTEEPPGRGQPLPQVGGST